MRGILERYLRYRTIATVAVAAVTALCLRGILLLQYDEDPRNLLKSRRASVAGTYDLPAGFSSNDLLAVVVLRGNDLLRPTPLEDMRQLVITLGQVQGVKTVESLFSARRKLRVGSYLLPLIPTTNAEPRRFEALVEEIDRHPYIVGHLLSTDHRIRSGSHSTA